MSAPAPGPKPLGARLARRWAWLYTRGLDPEIDEARRAEIESDIFEQLSASHPNTRRTAAAIAGRTMRGVPGDLAWRGEERAMNHRAESALTAGPARHLRWLALVPLVFAVPFLAWSTAVGVSAAVALILGAMVIWRVFSGAWPPNSVRRRA